MNQYYIEWEKEKISRYILGTAQLGLNYGIANKDGKPDLDKVDRIIKSAWTAGARTFDTAAGYGDSESVLGMSLVNNDFLASSKIITKISPPKNFGNYYEIRISIENSLSKLGVSSIWAVLLHRYDMLEQWDDGLGKILKKLKDEKKVSHLGVSVYTPEEVENALNYPDIEIIQAPCNLWSPELFSEDIIKSASKKNKLIIVRSLFLQGLLLMKPDDVNIRLPAAYSASMEWNKILDEWKTNAWDLCMQFAASLNAPVIMGADNEVQAGLNGKFLSAKSLTDCEIDEIYLRIKPYLSKDITNPTMWK